MLILGLGLQVNFVDLVLECVLESLVCWCVGSFQKILGKIVSLA